MLGINLRTLGGVADATWRSLHDDSPPPRKLSLLVLALFLISLSTIVSAYHCCGAYMYCPDPGDPLPGGGTYNPPPPPPTAVPGSGGSPSEYEAIEALPSMSVVPNNLYYATYMVCEGGVDEPGGCAAFLFSWYDQPGADLATADPCCMGIVLHTQWYTVVVTNASGLPHAYQPMPAAWDEIQAMHADVLSVDPLPPGDSRCSSVGAQLPYASFVGCTPISPYLHIDGAHEIDHVTIDMDPDRGYPYAGDHGKAIDHKFY